jgi:LysM repeat protein
VPDAPRTEPVPKHTVAKGETLTSIAKLYNITVSELQKVNKIENDRKLQIGQTLTIPPAKNPESTTEKKENP